MRPSVLDVAPGALSEYYEWFKRAKDGAILVYWKGDLRYDRDPDHFDPSELGEKQPIINALNSVANRIWVDAKEGHLVLMQKKIEDNVYEYRAVRLRAPAEAVAQRGPHGNVLVHS